MYEVYEEGDSILPGMELPNPVNIRIEIKDDSVALFVGRRDWSWNRKTGELNGSGFALEYPTADDSPKI